MARIIGSHRPGVHDTLEGTEQSDWIWLGRRGFGDWAYGNGGDDILRGSADDDNLDGGDGNDRIRGGDSSDNMWGGAGDDRINGNAGDDSLDGGEGNDILIGAAGNDGIFGRLGNDIAYGGEGDDAIFGGSGIDYLEGNLGDDTLSLDRGLAFGGWGDDLLLAFPEGPGGHASLDGGPGSDIYSVTMTRGVGTPLSAVEITFDADDRLSVSVQDQLGMQVGRTLAWDTNGDGVINTLDPDSIFGAVRSDGVSTLWLWAGDGAGTGYSAAVVIHGVTQLGMDDFLL